MQDSPENKESNINYPQLRFGVNKKLHIDAMTRFLKIKEPYKGVADFRKTIQNKNPGLVDCGGLDPTQIEERVTEYLNGRYKGKEELFKAASQDIDMAWRNYQNTFYQEVEKIFNNHPWPKGDYIGFLSFGMPCPRYLNTKTFMVPYTPIEQSVRTTVHEMLHFIFYDYVRQRYLPEMDNTIQKEMEQKLGGKFMIPLWEMSEVFNMIVLPGEEWGVGKANVDPTSYGKLQNLIPEVKNIWNQSGHNIDVFFTKMEV